MLILHDPETLRHNTVELLGSRLIGALECPARVESILQAIGSTSQHILKIINVDNDAETTTHAVLRNTHDHGYLEHLEYSHADWISAGHISENESILPECFPTFKLPSVDCSNSRGSARINIPKDRFARTGFYAFDMSTGIMKDTYKSAVASANLAVTAATLVSENRALSAVFGLCRPPGHHCDTTKAGGYCYINNCVVAAEILLSRQNLSSAICDSSIVILDLDFHHGNGTQSYFYDRKVRYISLHGQDEYPYYSGSESERGEGPGEGYNHNFPLPLKTSAERYSEVLGKALNLCTSAGPRYLVLSLGFDTFHLDPLGSFDLQTHDYANVGYQVARTALAHGIQTIILLEGGYVLEKLGSNVSSFLAGWARATAELT